MMDPVCSPDRKVYVDVDATFGADGRLIPRAVYWSDGTKYEITSVRGCVAASAPSCGSYGQRYTVTINNRSAFLFFEPMIKWDNVCPGRWFVEKKHE